MKKLKILVLGAGYIGKKHCINLKELGADVSIFDTDPTQMAWCVQEGFEWVEEIKGDYDGAVIATPPEFHYRNLNDMYDFGMPLLIEKPLFLVLPDELKWEHTNNIMMAHNYLFMEELWKFKREMIAPLRGGRHWQYISADYLPHWHGPEFADSYQERHEARDGCMAVSVSHAIYILDYLFGMPDREEYYKDNYSIIETKGDNSVQGIRVNEHSTVTIIESWSAKKREHYLKEIGSQHGFNWTNHNEDVLGSHKRMMTKFLQVIKGESEIPPLCRLEEGIRITQQIEAAEFLSNDYE